MFQSNWLSDTNNKKGPLNIYIKGINFRDEENISIEMHLKGL